MAINPSPAVNSFTKKYSAAKQTVIKVIPTVSANLLERRPDGKGRFLVRSINASISFSITQLMMQAPPTKPEVAMIDMTAVKRSIEPGARNKPKAQVKITNEDKRGFVREKTSRQAVALKTGMATEVTVLIVIIMLSTLCNSELNNIIKNLRIKP